MSTWREEAAGIRPWDGARLCYLGTPPLPPGVLSRYGTAYIHPNEEHLYVVDLSDPDTRAAFDRRLATRLGAPEDAVSEGVVFYRVGTICYITAGWNVETGRPRWTYDLNDDGYWPGDALYARVRAWKSVEAP